VLGPVNAVLADVSRPEDRARTFGLVGAAYGVGMTAGPAMGGFVAELGTRAPFWLAAGLSAVNAVAMLALLPETLADDKRRPVRLAEANVVGAFRPLLGLAGAAPLLFVWFLWQVADQVYPATWSFWGTERFGWGAAAIGWSFAWMGLTELVVQLALTDRLVRRLGEWGTALIGLGASAATIAGFAFVTETWQVYPILLAGSLGALAWPALNALLSRLVDETRQGVLQGGLNSVNSVAAAIGPVMGTQALAWGSGQGLVGLAFLLAAGLLAAAWVIVLAAVPREVAGGSEAPPEASGGEARADPRPEAEQAAAA